MTHLALIPRHRAGPELRAAYDRVAVERLGAKAPPMTPLIMQCVSHRPALVDAVSLAYFYIGWGSATPRSVLETAAVMVSKQNDCFY